MHILPPPPPPPQIEKLRCVLNLRKVHIWNVFPKTIFKNLTHLKFDGKIFHIQLEHFDLCPSLWSPDLVSTLGNFSSLLCQDRFLAHIKLTMCFSFILKPPLPKQTLVNPSPVFIILVKMNFYPHKILSSHSSDCRVLPFTFWDEASCGLVLRQH
jgi:hypothetical protein